MENKDKKGIYCIINKFNYKRYIGSTSDSFKKRWWLHKWQLNNNKHKNIHLQNAWNKYGSENFEFIIIEILSGSFLEKEQKWIDLYDFNMLYNINPTATGGMQFTDDIIKKRTLSNKKRYKVLTDKYKLWKENKIFNNELSEYELNQFEYWFNFTPWNKGKKYKSTEHLKVPKKKKGDRTKDKLTKRKKLLEIEVYDINMNFLKLFNSAKDLEEWSLTSENNLPIKSRFNSARMGKPINFLQSVNINKSCKTGKPYKNLYFKFKQSPL